MDGQYAPMLDAEVLRDFVFAGKRYTKGDAFPHRTLGPRGGEMVDIERRGLFGAGLIKFVAPMRASESAPRVEPKHQQRR